MFCKATGTVYEWWLETVGDGAEDDGFQYCDSKSRSVNPTERQWLLFSNPGEDSGERWVPSFIIYA